MGGWCNTSFSRHIIQNTDKSLKTPIRELINHIIYQSIDFSTDNQQLQQS